VVNLITGKASLSMAKSSLWFGKKKAEEFGLDPAFVKAVAMVESNGNPLVVRYEPKWRYFLDPEKWAKKHLITVETERVLQAMSWGPLQIMGTKARELGFDGMLTELADPNISGHYSCMFLKKLFDKWIDPLTVAASYNAGSPLRDPATGQFRNQEYVNRITEKLEGV
jgi:soluble lytic murein transglycosylase-like protein